MSEKRRIGLIAGRGNFPLHWIESAKKRGVEVITVAFRGQTQQKVARLSDKFLYIRVSDIKRLISFFKENGIEELVMCGQINPFLLFTRELFLSIDIAKLLKSLKDKRADTIFSAVVQRLEEEGFNILPSTLYMDDYMPSAGKIGQKMPDDAQMLDIQFGKEIAKYMGGLDIGQTVVVKDKVVLAVEAFEGTNSCIMRGGLLARKGAVVVKMSKPNQDLRFDVPVVGLNTLRVMKHARCSVLAIEAGKTILLDRDKAARYADKNNIKIIAV